jgi:small subunit ribosomal protein S9
MNSRQYVEGIGRRKEATARVRLYAGGTGVFTINDKPADQYLTRMGDLDAALLPLRLLRHGEQLRYDRQGARRRRYRSD